MSQHMGTLTYQYRLYPTPGQAKSLLGLMERMRWLYNAALQQRQEAWTRITVAHCDAKGRRKGQSISYETQTKELTVLRQADPEWGALNCVMSREPLRRADLAFQAFFRRCKAGQTPGYPRFRRKDTYNTLAFEPEGRYRLTQGAPLLVPGVEGGIRAVWHRPWEGTARQVKVTHEAGRWYACVTCVDVPDRPLPKTGRVAGVDMGVSCFLAVSDGEGEAIVPNPRHLDRAAARLERAQRKLAAKDQRILRARQRANGASEAPVRLTREERRSGKRQRLLERIQRAHAGVAQARKDFHHKTALDLLRRADLVGVEDLKVKNMTRSAKGTVDEPGKNVAQKAGLNRAILDAGWGGFLTTLEGKAAHRGREVVRVDPKGTSQRCSGCGATVRKDLSVRVHECPACGMVLDRDLNAARNIRQAVKS